MAVSMVKKKKKEKELMNEMDEVLALPYSKC